MSEIKITYETLFDLLRRERNREELQTLDETFFADVLAYMSEKKALLDQLHSSGEYISSEGERAKIQFQNIKKILKELYDRREKKIVLLAVSAVKIGSDFVDKKSFLPEEKHLFDKLLHILSVFRTDILDNLLRQISPYANALNPSSSYASPASSISASSRAPSASSQISEQPSTTGRTQNEGSQISAASQTAQSASSQTAKDPSQTKIKFIKSVPKFAGADKAVFGPFEVGDVADLPEKIAQILIKKNRAEKAA